MCDCDCECYCSVSWIPCSGRWCHPHLLSTTKHVPPNILTSKHHHHHQHSSPPLPGLFHPDRCDTRCQERTLQLLLLLLLFLLLVSFAESPFTLLLIRRPRRQQCSLALGLSWRTGPVLGPVPTPHSTATVTLLSPLPTVVRPPHTTPHHTTNPSSHPLVPSDHGGHLLSLLSGWAVWSVSKGWVEHQTQSCVEAEPSEATIPVDLLHSSQCGLAAVKPQQQHGLERSPPPPHQHSRYHLSFRVNHRL